MALVRIRVTEGQVPGLIGSLDVRNRGSLTSNFVKNLNVRGMSFPLGIDPPGDLPIRQVKSVTVQER